MNEPLKFKLFSVYGQIKFKLFSVYGQILHKDVLLESFKRVKKNNGCAGVDKVSIKKFEEHLDENIEVILNELKNHVLNNNLILKP